MERLRRMRKGIDLRGIDTSDEACHSKIKKVTFFEIHRNL